MKGSISTAWLGRCKNCPDDQRKNCPFDPTPGSEREAVRVAFAV